MVQCDYATPAAGFQKTLNPRAQAADSRARGHPAATVAARGKGKKMQHIQLVNARQPEQARDAYLQGLARRGVRLAPMAEVFVETVHRPQAVQGAWLCYVALPGRRAA